MNNEFLQTMQTSDLLAFLNRMQNLNFNDFEIIFSVDSFSAKSKILYVENLFLQYQKNVLHFIGKLDYSNTNKFFLYVQHNILIQDKSRLVKMLESSLTRNKLELRRLMSIDSSVITNEEIDVIEELSDILAMDKRDLETNKRELYYLISGRKQIDISKKHYYFDKKVKVTNKLNNEVDNNLFQISSKYNYLNHSVYIVDKITCKFEIEYSFDFGK